jgi:Protein of unknown function (DUF1349)
MSRVHVHPSLPLAALLLLAAVAFPAPVPKDFDTPAKKLARTFGKTTPSPKGGEFRFDATALTAKMPAARFGNENVPHAGMHTQTVVSGNFAAEVTIRLTPADGLLVPNEVFSLGGGMFAREPDKESRAVATVTLSLINRWLRPQMVSAWERNTLFRVNGKNVSADEDAPVDPAVPYRLRLTREGDTFAAAMSDDGKEWRTLAPQKLTLPKAVGVGVFCYNRTGETADAVFEGFSIRPLK